MLLIHFKKKLKLKNCASKDISETTIIGTHATMSDNYVNQNLFSFLRSL